MDKSLTLYDLVTRNTKISKTEKPVISQVAYVSRAFECADYPCLITFFRLNNKGKSNATIVFRSLSPIYIPKCFERPTSIKGDTYPFILTQKEAFQSDFFRPFNYKKNNIQDLVNKISNQIFVIIPYYKNGERKIGTCLETHPRTDEIKQVIGDDLSLLPFSLVPSLPGKELSRLENSLAFNLSCYPLDLFPLPDWVYGEKKLYKITSYNKTSEKDNTTHFVANKARAYEVKDESRVISYNNYVFVPISKIVTKDTPCLYSLPLEKGRTKPVEQESVPAPIIRIDESIIKKTYAKYPNDSRPSDVHIRNIVSGISKVIKSFHQKNYDQMQIDISRIRDELRFVFYVIVKNTAPNNRCKNKRVNVSSFRKYVSGRQDFFDIYRKGRERNKTRPGGIFYLSDTIFLFDAFSHLFNDEYSRANQEKIEAFRKKSPSGQDALLYSFIYFFFNLNLTNEEKDRLDKAFSVEARIKQIKEKNGN